MVRPVAVLLGALLLAGNTRYVEVHPLHMSLTEIHREGPKGRITISVRLFADDFGSLLDSISKDREAAARFYVAPRVVLSSGSTTVKLEWCGWRTEGNLTWVCLRSAAPVPPGKLHLRNTLMFDRFSDQVSVVRADRRTIVLSSRVPEGALD